MEPQDERVKQQIPLVNKALDTHPLAFTEVFGPQKHSCHQGAKQRGAWQSGSNGILINGQMLAHVDPKGPVGSHVR